MKIVTAAEMRALDEAASAVYGIPSIVLMENAGLQVFAEIKEMLGEVKGKRVLVFVGRGNNGGDGFVVARHLINAGAEVKIFLLCRSEEIKGDAGVNFQICKQMRAKIYPLQNGERDLQKVNISLLYADLAVDAIYGTGFRGVVTGLAAEVIEILNRSGKPIVAVDLPSGLEADTGRVNGPCIGATRTVTFCLPKLGLLLEPGAEYVGKLRVADITIPQSLVAQQKTNRELLTATWCASQLPRRNPEAHKGDFGHVFIAGGAEGMTGAVTMAGLAALRSGAGLVTLGVPRSLHPLLEAKTLEVMTRPLPETEGSSLSREAAAPLLDLANERSVLALGPGMSRHPAGKELLRAVLPEVKVPVVIDADGLNLLAELLAAEPEFLKKVKAPLILTPHPGEMARLLRVSNAEIQKDRLEKAQQASVAWGCVVVLKGAKTVVASPEGKIYLNPTGNPGMATAGTGDVLTGIIAGFLAQGLNPLTAAAVGVYVHGASGDRAAQVKGKKGLIAGDLIAYLPLVLKEIEEGSFVAACLGRS